MKEILREDFLAGKPRLVNMNQLGEALHRLQEPSDSKPVRLSFQPGGRGAGPEPGLERPGEGRPFHGRSRKVYDGHGPLCRHRPSGHELAGAQRSLPFLRNVLHSTGQGPDPSRGREQIQLGGFLPSGRGHGISRAFFPAVGGGSDRSPGLHSQPPAGRDRSGGFSGGESRGAPFSGRRENAIQDPFRENRNSKSQGTPAVAGLFPSLWGGFPLPVDDRRRACSG